MLGYIEPMDYFLWPWTILILPLPWVVRFFARRFRPAKASYILDALYVPFFDRIAGLAKTRQPISLISKNICLITAWCLLVIAGMRPFRYETDMPNHHEARNIMLAIDLSGSMAQQDFHVNGTPVTRIQVVKDVVQDFVNRRGGDRLGLVIFGSSAHTLAPLSSDMKTLEDLFQDVDLGIAGEKTAIGDALALAVQDTAKVPEGKKAIILLSDGFNNAGAVSIPQAISLAKKQGIIVYTVGIGTTQRKIKNVWDLFGSGNYSWDEKTLRQIAEGTDGHYFYAETTEDLQGVYRKIDRMETTSVEGISIRPRRDLFYYPAAAALLFWFLAQRRRRSK